jgi:hypothetical protein
MVMSPILTCRIFASPPDFVEVSVKSIEGIGNQLPPAFSTCRLCANKPTSPESRVSSPKAEAPAPFAEFRYRCQDGLKRERN